ncbi:ABC-type sugar transport system substrate-binding protein [Aequitasia blattaphilus]|uniref:Substrate-binding domain-containing protein n=1 Tax=Aequitasia blattaphilus TaxID=2949332 RepID=A0ABT1EBT6_9FIRM|nr:substrate-binding domain-containing protein [Aequitasia blattaphilus]MCP1103285.1 substrate-binding domain-containing protein [Aequitasia blattaphilus]MCR8615925.1 substrate-binding domain-containing protein [Aequitasia blattaphilus]
MKKRLIGALLVVSMAATMLIGCGAADKDAKKESNTEDTQTEGKVKIGMTLYSLKNEFTVRLANAAEAKAEELGIELVVYDGNYDPSTQISQVETMISDGCDGIILNPQDAEACAPCVDKAADAGIPVVGVNTRVKSDKLTSYVGSIDVTAGEMEMQKIVDLLDGKGNIVIIEGPMGQSAQIERREGIQNILDKYPDIKVLAEKTANWSRSEGMTVMENWLQAFDNIDAVVGENDEMALGAREAIKAAGKDIPAIGVDGITDALNAVEEDNLVASIFQDGAGQGSKAVEVLLDAINGETVEENYWIDFEEVNKDNVEEFKQRAQ